MKFNRAELSYFLSLLAVGSMLGLWFVAPMLSLALMGLGLGYGSLVWTQGLTIALVVLVLGAVWKQQGALVPAAIASGREKRFRLGSVLTGLANLAVGLALLGCVLGYLLHREFFLAAGFVIAGALMLALPLNIVGILCIETSRQRP
ncbi:UNVERIFIED_ORG: hypothetical protein LHJ69_17670 [Shinella sp. XGS7]|nr:hypothetical protein [Shinella sp. XGS7]